MKKLYSILILTALVFTNCAENDKKKDEIKESESMDSEQSEEVSTDTDTQDIAFNNTEASEIWTDYLNLKTALVESDVERTKSAAGELSLNFQENPRNAFKSFAVQIQESSDLEEQRKIFSDLSGQMENYFSEEINSGKIYKQYCPMAFGNNGAYWLSNEEKIKNPYFGNKMLTCGKVTQTIQ